MDKNELLQCKQSCYDQLKTLKKKILYLEQLRCSLENEAMTLRNQFKDYDRKLAEIDGRLTRLEHDGSIKKNSELAKFEQLPIADRIMIINALKDVNEGLLQ